MVVGVFHGHEEKSVTEMGGDVTEDCRFHTTCTLQVSDCTVKGYERTTIKIIRSLHNKIFL